MWPRLFVLFLWMIAVPAHAQDTRGALPLQPTTSEPDGAISVRQNAAGLAALQSWDVRVFNTQLNDRRGEGTALFFGTPVFGPLSLGLGLEFLRPDPSPYHHEQLSFGAAWQFHPSFRAGLSFHHVFSDDSKPIDGTNSLELGLLARPFSWLSLGLVVRDLNTPEIGGQVHPRTYTLGLGFQPGTERVTLESGVTVDEEGDSLAIMGRVRAEIFRGIELSVNTIYEPERCFGDACLEQLSLGASLGVEFGAGGVESGVHMRISDEELVLDGYTIGVRLSGASRGPVIRRTEKTVVVEFAAASEVPKPGITGGGATFLHQVAALDAMTRDETISGVLIRDKGSQHGWAQAEEIRALLLALKSAGKRVIVYLDEGGFRHLYTYSVADRIIVNPAGGLMITGLKTTLSFYREALDHLQVDTQWVRYGRYKSYPESFEQMAPSADAQEVRNSILDTLYAQATAGIGEGRGLSAEEVQARVDQGPCVAAQCKERGLIDHIAFYDEVEKTLTEDFGAALRLVPARGATRSLMAPWGRKPVIAVIPVVGTIVQGASSVVPILGTRQAGSRTIIPAIQAAARDPRVVGILLRVDSPGGSSAASDHIHRALVKASESKPVVASFGNVAASGGYYVAMGAREVFSSDATVTGSIGIFLGKPAFGRLFTMLGIGRDTLTRGRWAELFGTDRPWTEEELTFLGEKVRTFYDLFLQRVADQRPLSVEEVEPLAAGRVWLGSQARERQLIDTHGGALAALKRVKVLAGLTPDEAVEIRFLPLPSLLERVRNTLGIEIAELLARAGNLRDALAIAYPFLHGFSPGEPLALMPFHLSVE